MVSKEFLKFKSCSWAHACKRKKKQRQESEEQRGSHYQQQHPYSRLACDSFITVTESMLQPPPPLSSLTIKMSTFSFPFFFSKFFFPWLFSCFLLVFSVRPEDVFFITISLCFVTLIHRGRNENFPVLFYFHFWNNQPTKIVCKKKKKKKLDYKL